MGKKTKKEVPPEVKFRRKVKKTIRRLIYLGILVAGYFWLLPTVVPGMSPQVEKTRSGLVSVAGQAQTSISQVLGSATQFTSELSKEAGQTQEKGAEALVQKTVDDLTKRVRELPGNEVKKVKIQFCADLIEEAVLSCQASESANED